MPDELSIDRLTALVGDRAASEDPIAQLAAAVQVAREARFLADQLLDRYIAAARERGRPWSEVGATLGISMPVPRQRFVAPAEPSAWSKHFSGDARTVVELAQRRARELGYPYLGPEHLLLALTEDPGLAGATLKKLGVDSAQVSEHIRSIAGPGDPTETAWRGSTPRTKRVLECALREALSLGHGRGRETAPVHVLLALSRCEKGVAAQIFRALHVTDDQLRDQLRELLAAEAPELAEQFRQARRRPWRI